MNKIIEHISNPPINCNPNNNNSDSVANPTIMGQKFCGNNFGNTPSSTKIKVNDPTKTIGKTLSSTDNPTIQIIGTVTFPNTMWSSPSSIMGSSTTITCNTKMFDPSLSNIDYECSGLCPTVYNGVGNVTWTPSAGIPASCNVISRNGPNVMLVTNNTNQVAAFSQADTKSIKKYVCPQNWSMTSTSSSIVDTTAYKNCYCKMGTSKKPTQTSTSSTRKGKTTTTYTTRYSCA